MIGNVETLDKVVIIDTLLRDFGKVLLELVKAAYALSTIPFLPRDPRRSDDVRSDEPNHPAVAESYALLGSNTGEKS